MDDKLADPFVLITCALVVLLSAMLRFNNPYIMLAKISGLKLSDHLKNIMSPSYGKQNLILRPARANTTIFRYRLYQLMYAIIGMLVYLILVFMPDILLQVQQIINYFYEDAPKMTNAGPLVIAVFVIFLPKLPPFHWADVKLRSLLYERALIPAQQLREMHRLKMAAYYPPVNIIKRVQELAVANGFDSTDISYNNEFATTHSLWSKCTILIEQIKIWEADDHYKTAFATLKESETEARSVDAVKDIYRNIVVDARVYFSELRLHNNEKTTELEQREMELRNNCKILLEKVYALLACVSLHSHYSDRERIFKFDKLGFKLTSENGPIPNSNDLLYLAIIMGIVLVLPLAYKLGLVKAIMIGTIMFSAVLTPIILAHLCPKICGSNADNEHNQYHYLPNIKFPLLAGIMAAFLGFMIFFIGGQFLEPSNFCSYTGYERYTNCSYPWGFIHAGIAIILAIRLNTGAYPDVKKLQGFQKYRLWGNFKDAIICLLLLLLITIFLVIPQLEALRGNTIDNIEYFKMVLRISLMGFVLGFIVPTWYRAQNRSVKVERRKDPKERERYTEELNIRRNGVKMGL